MQPQDQIPNPINQSTQTPQQPVNPPHLDTNPDPQLAPTVISINSQQPTSPKPPILIIVIICTIILATLIAGAALLAFKSNSGDKPSKTPQKAPATTLVEEKPTDVNANTPEPAPYTPYPADVRQNFTASCVKSYPGSEVECACMLDYFERTSVSLEAAVNFADETKTVISQETLDALGRASRVCNL